MIALGLTCSPLDFCISLKQAKEKYSVNEVTRAPISIFMTLKDFARLRQRRIDKRLVIFDTLERLEMVKGLNILKQKTAATLLPLVLEYTKESDELSIESRNHVKEIIEQNKNDDTSLLHTYNTNLYNISFSPTRDSIRQSYLNFMIGCITRSQFEKEIATLYPKRGKSLTAVDNLMELTNTDLFKRMQTAILKAKGKSTKDVESVAQKYEVTAFDLRYFLSVIK